jgi:UTP-glucose-1-phosphate uridylyltransferase
MIGVAVPKDTVGKYGVIASHEDQGALIFDHIQEKPRVEEAKSNLINVSKYLFEASFFSFLEAAMQQPADGEYFITDPLNAYVEAGNSLYVLPAHGKYLDGGTVENWLYANEFVMQHPQTESEEAHKNSGAELASSV